MDTDRNTYAKACDALSKHHLVPSQVLDSAYPNSLKTASQHTKTIDNSEFPHYNAKVASNALNSGWHSAI